MDIPYVLDASSALGIRTAPRSAPFARLHLQKHMSISTFEPRIYNISDASRFFGVCCTMCSKVSADVITEEPARRLQTHDRHGIASRCVRPCVSSMLCQQRLGMMMSTRKYMLDYAWGTFQSTSNALAFTFARWKPQCAACQPLRFRAKDWLLQLRTFRWTTRPNRFFVMQA